MYKFSKLFIKNLLFASLFAILIAMLALLLIKVYVETENKKHQQTIQVISKQLASHSDDTRQTAEAITEILTRSYTYQSLLIRDKENSYTSLISKQKNWLSPLLTQPKNILINKPKLQIQYQLNSSELINLITQLFIGIVILTLVFALISAKLNYKLQASIFSIISKHCS
jgi:hypothetical protein